MLPAPLMVSEPGSFAEYTIVQRKPKIIADIIAYNRYPAKINGALRAFGKEIATGTVAPLYEDAADVAFWRETWRPWRGKTWRQLSWFFAETYFYRRVLEIVGYFQPGPWQGVDPFEAQKHQALAKGTEMLGKFYAALPRGLFLREQFSLWLRRSLWGNRADLSSIALSAVDETIGGESMDRLVIDHTEAVWEMLSAGDVRRLDLVADNSGLELVSDLGLLDVLLSHELVETVHLHLKNQPFFVSDATIEDLAATLDALRDAQHPALCGLAHRLEAQRQGGRLVAHDHPFWATCLFFNEFPPDLRDVLFRSDLLVLKGDVNYRRLLSDRHWPHTTSLAALAAYMPVSFLALRTLKGELVVGLPEGRAEELATQDPDWLINGERGLIHLVRREQARSCENKSTHRPVTPRAASHVPSIRNG